MDMDMHCADANANSDAMRVMGAVETSGHGLRRDGR